MRQIIASAVIAAVVFSAASPTFAQRTRRVVKRPVAVKPKPDPVSTARTGSLADFESIEAVTSGKGVVINWVMKQETRVAFYQVYRVDGKGRVAVGQPVLGSAARTNFPTQYGEKYSTVDTEGTTDSNYEIDAVGNNGPEWVTSSRITAKYQRGTDHAVEAAVDLAAARAESSSIETVSPAGASASAQAPDPNNQKWVASQPGVKIAVRKDGIYRVMRAELQGVGFNVGSNSANWRLFMEGNEQPIKVGPADQYIEFYGKSLDTNESDTRMYYLIADSMPGLRMQTRVMRSFGGTAFASAFRTTVEKKERINYLPKIFNGPTENFWGGLITTTSYPVKVVLPNVDRNSPDLVTLSIKLQGFSSTLHDVQVTLNGQLLSGNGNQMTGQYSDNFSKDYVVPASSLVDGVNTLSFASTPVPPCPVQPCPPPGPGYTGDFSVFDTVKVTYAQKFQGYQNQTTIFSPGRRKVVLDGFKSPTGATITIPFGALSAGPAVTPTAAATASTTPGVLRLVGPTIIAGTTPNPVTNQPPLPVARVTVVRAFGSTGTVSADLTLTDGTATGGAACGGGVDYVLPASPTVTLADGVIAKDVDVQICTGNVADPNGETFSASLSNPTGGATLPTSNVRVYDLSYDDVRTVSGLTPTQNGNNYGVIVPSYRASTLFAADESFALAPASVTANTPSTLSAPGNAADMLIITYSSPGFMTAAQNWATYRQSAAGGSLNTKVVDIADIYDEFNYGVLSTQAINDFLHFTYSDPNWTTHPRYVLLMGDSSYDARNYEAKPIFVNLIPTKLVELVFEESGSDEALADFNGDGLAEIPIGRIPAIDPAKVALVQSKTQAQETAAMQNFGRGAVFVNDKPIGYDFYALNQDIRSHIPTITSATFVNREDFFYPNPPSPCSQTVACQDDVGAHAAVVNALNTGPYIVNYSGHGAAGLWGASAFFNLGHVPELTNPNQSIYTMLTCFNGYFLRTPTFFQGQWIEVDSLAEVLLKTNGGGGSIVWASTTETTPDIQLVMANRFYSQLNAGTLKRVGDLITDAKSQVQGNSDVRYSWALLGDPATQIRP